MHFVEKLENDLIFCHLYHCRHHMYISFQLLCVFVSLWKSSPVVHNISEPILKRNNMSQTFFALTQIPLCHHFWLGIFWQAVGGTPQCVAGGGRTSLSLFSGLRTPVPLWRRVRFGTHGIGDPGRAGAQWQACPSQAINAEGKDPRPTASHFWGLHKGLMAWCK